MVMGRTERNLHSYMAEFIKLVNGYNTFSIQEQKYQDNKTDKKQKKNCVKGYIPSPVQHSAAVL